MKNNTSKISRIFAIVFSGFFGSWLCSFLIFSFSAILGSSCGYSGKKYEAYFDFQESVIWTLFFGATIGLVIFIFCYSLFSKKFTFKNMMLLFLKTTLVGCLFGLVNSEIALLGGAFFFIVFSALLHQRNS